MQATTSLPRQAVTRNALTSRRHVSSGTAAAYASVSRNTIKSLVASGELEAYQTKGGHFRIATSSLLSFVDGIVF